MKLRLSLTLCFIAGGLVSPVLAEPDLENGRTLARTQCARCHGADGNARSTSFQPVPMLAGQPASYLVKEVQNYASGARADGSKNARMSEVLRELSAQDIEDVAAYYSAQERH